MRLHDLCEVPPGASAQYSDFCARHGEFTVPAVYLGGKLRSTVASCPRCVQLLDAELGDAEIRRHQTRVESVQRTREAATGIRRRWWPEQAGPYVPPNSRAQANLDAVQTFAQNWSDTAAAGRTMILCGKTGTGKTHLACLAGTTVFRRHGATVQYATLARMTRHIRASYARGRAPYTETEAIERYSQCDLLLLDELGTRAQTDHDRALLLEVIDERYLDLRPSIVISNLLPSELGPATDERLIDRLRETGSLLVFDWESHRSRRV